MDNAVNILEQKRYRKKSECATMVRLRNQETHLLK